ncbi:MAG: hypothetical protein NZ893_03310 [Candidatus Aenigmarchaeota archaeon]|nr:hypothetical protein [Candidatus Aenigmarchaeota archaeon]
MVSIRGVRFTPKDILPNLKYPTARDLYGKPDRPKAYCSKCKGLFYPEDLQVIKKDAENEIWLCPKCNFKFNLRKSFKW